MPGLQKRQGKCAPGRAFLFQRVVRDAIAATRESGDSPNLYRVLNARPQWLLEPIQFPEKSRQLATLSGRECRFPGDRAKGT